MKRVLLLSIIIIPLLLDNAFSQDQGKVLFFRNQIGIQFNPYINEQFFDFRYINTISALRYGYRITQNFTTGLEFSCSYPINISSIQDFQIYNYFIYNIGLVTKYSILSERRFQIFAEVTPYFSHYFREWTSSSDLTPFRTSEFGYYAAPGISLYSRNKKFSLDLYYKFSNLTFVNGKKSVFSYKVNFSF